MTTPRFHCTEFNCTETEAHLPLFVGDELDERAMVSVRLHLDGCAPCQANLSALRSALAAFEVERERRDPVVDLWPGIEAELTRVGVLAVGVPTGASSVAAAVPSNSETATASKANASTGPRPLPSVLGGPSALGRRRVWRQAASLAAAAAIVVVAFQSWQSSPGGGPDVRPTEVAPAAKSAVVDGPSIAFVPPAQVQQVHGVEAVVDGNAQPTSPGLAALVHGAAASAPVGELSSEDATIGIGVGGLRRLTPGEAPLSESLRVRAGSSYSLAGDRAGLR